jgi:hypothetical protein
MSGSSLTSYRSRANTLLGHLGVTRIVVIDDEAHRWRLTTIGASPPKELSAPTYREAGGDDDFDSIQKWREEVLEEEAAQDPAKVARWHQSALKKHPNMALSELDRLVVVFEDQLVLLTPNEWERLNSEELDDLSRDSLFLFDRELGAFGKKGEQLLSEFETKYSDAKSGIFTSQADPGQDELKAEIVVSKHRLDEDEKVGSFIEELRLVAMAPLVRNLREILLDLAADAHKRACDEVRNYSLRVLEAIVIGRSRHEGVFEGDTLMRVLDIEFQDLRDKGLIEGGDESKLTQVLTLLNSARALMPEELSTPDADEQAESLMNRERYSADVIINRPGLPLANGDIFEGENGDRWMLLEQPCDLQLRDTSNTRDLITFVQLIAIEEEVRATEHSWKLPSVAPCPGHLVFKKRLSVPLDVLEICVFDPDGHCRWPKDGNPKIIHPLTPALDRRKKKINERMKRLVDLLRANSNREIRDRYLLRAGDIQGQNTRHYLKWPLRRFSRLSESWSAVALAALAANKSRPGLDGDLVLDASAAEKQEPSQSQ